MEHRILSIKQYIALWAEKSNKKKKQNALRFVCVRKPDILRIFYPIEAGMTECRQHEWQYMSERANINTKRRTHIILTAHAHRSTLTFTSNEHSRHTQIHSQSVGFGRISKNTRFFFLLDIQMAAERSHQFGSSSHCACLIWCSFVFLLSRLFIIRARKLCSLLSLPFDKRMKRRKKNDAHTTEIRDQPRL